MKICKLSNQANRIFFSFLIAFILIPSTTAQASTDIYLIQTAVNDRTWTIEGAVVKDTIGWLGKTPLEGQRFGSSIEILTKSAGSIGDSGIAVLIEESEANTQKNGTAKENLPLSFPSYSDTSLNPFAKLGGTESDKSRANTVLNALLYDFQLAFDLAYPDRSGWTMEKFQTNVTAFLSSAGGGGVVGSATFSRISSLPSGYRVYDNTSAPTDYIKVTADGVDYYLMYRIPKGYVDILSDSYDRDLTGLGLITTDGTKTGLTDVEFINWDMLVAEAVLGYHLESSHQVNVSNVSSGDMTAFESMMVGLFNNLYQDIVSMLNLWPIEQLVFSQGLRGTSAYPAGIFPSSWEGVIWGLFMVSQLIAIIMLFWVLIQTAAQRAMSTVNFMDRVMAWERIKKIIFSALILASLPVVIQLLMQLSDGLTQVIVSAFGSLEDNTIQDKRDAITSSTGGFGVILACFLLIGVDCYFNFVYTVRGLMVAMLIITGPIFIVLSITGKQYQKALSSWISQLLSNIFIQPVHALAFTLILILPQSTRSFENLLMIFATIPFSLATKKIFFPDGGDFAENTAMQARDKGTQGAAKVGAGAAMMAGGAASLTGGFSKGVSGKPNTGGSGGSGATGEGVTSGGSGGMGASGAGGVGSSGSSKSYNTTTPDSKTQTSSPVGATCGAGGSGGAQNSSSPKPNTTHHQANQQVTNLSNESSSGDNLDNPSASDSQSSMSGAVLRTGGKAAPAIGKGLWTGGQIAAGTAMTLAGAGMTASGMGQVGNSFAKGGRALVGSGAYMCGAGLRAGAKAVGSSVSIGASGRRIDKVPSGVPHEASTGKFSQGNPLYQYGNTSTSLNKAGAPLTSTNMSQLDLADAGISNLTSNDNSEMIHFDVDGDSSYGKEIAAHCHLLEQCETSEERQAMVNQSGIDATPIMKGGEETGSYRVGINKNSYNEATDSNIHTDKKGNMTVNAQGGEVGNLIPQYSVERTINRADENGKMQKDSFSNYDIRPTEAVRVTEATKNKTNRLEENGNYAEVTLAPFERSSHHTANITNAGTNTNYQAGNKQGNSNRGNSNRGNSNRSNSNQGKSNQGNSNQGNSNQGGEQQSSIQTSGMSQNTCNNTGDNKP